MLDELLIKNFAIIDNISISFDRGLNILSGETGAGKSIIINAVNLLLGGRANSETIRTGEETATVEASFSISKNTSALKRLARHGFTTDGLIIKRTISRSGKNRIYINDSLASLTILQDITSGLIEISAQHEHQTIQDPDKHIVILDHFANHRALLSEYQKAFSDLKKMLEEKKKLESSRREQSAKLDFIAFQLKEIESACLKEGEDQELEERRKVLLNLARIQELANSSYDAIYDSENSIMDRFNRAKQDLGKLSSIDEGTKPLADQADRIYFEMEDLSMNLRDYRSHLSENTDDLDSIEDRLHLLGNLKKKYGETITGVIRENFRLKNELGIYENYEDHLKDLTSEIEVNLKRTQVLASELTTARKKAGRLLSSNLHQELKELALEKTKVSVLIHALTRGKKPLIAADSETDILHENDLALNDMGMDEVEFLCSTNIGEELKPIVKIASGGELSRFMLAFKQVLSSTDDTSVYIFDEVDSGISGAQAEIVGRKIRSVSEKSQVICITHLPQIACQADVQFRVEKIEKKGRTIVNVRRLTRSERIDEISRMLGGINVPQSAIDHARTLIDNCS